MLASIVKRRRGGRGGGIHTHKHTNRAPRQLKEEGSSLKTTTNESSKESSETRKARNYLQQQREQIRSVLIPQLSSNRLNIQQKPKKSYFNNNKNTTIPENSESERETTKSRSGSRSNSSSRRRRSKRNGDKEPNCHARTVLSAAQFLLLPITEGRRPQVRTAQSSHACRPA